MMDMMHRINRMVLGHYKQYKREKTNSYKQHINIVLNPNKDLISKQVQTIQLENKLNAF